MTDWQERIDRLTATPIVVEHATRYRFAAPLLPGSGAWIDLGCGTGLAAASSYGTDVPARALLVDRDEHALAEAAHAFPGARAEQLDLADAGALEVVAAFAAETTGGPSLITCFETVEHLESFAPLIDLVRRLADSCNIVLSVPNDAATGVQNPYHETVWGRAAIDELRSQLPESARVLAQRPLVGSIIADDEPVEGSPPLSGWDGDPQPSHFVIALGPGVADLEPVSAVAVTPIDAVVAFEREREASLAYLKDEVERLQQLLDAQEP